MSKMSMNNNNNNLQPIRTVTEWDDEYARMARIAASQFRTTPGYSMKHQPAPDMRTFQQGLQRLDHSLSASASSPIASSLSSTEIQRRRRLIQHLQQTSGGGNAGTVDLLSGTTNSNDGLQQRLQQQQSSSQQPQPPQQQSKMTVALRQQDDMIDQLAVGVNRLKQQTTVIGEEAAMQVNLMNDMDHNLDATYNTMHDQTQRAASLRDDQSIWRLQLIVVALTILLILEILAGLTP
jgi:hypothetical protein